MKKTLLSVIFAAVTGFIGVNAADAQPATATPATPAASNVSFSDLRRAGLDSAKMDSIKTTRVIYQFKDSNGESAVVMVRAKKYDKVRVDFWVGKVLYSTARDGDIFWSFNTKEGYDRLDELNASEFKQFVEFLAVPFFKENILTNPVLKGEDENNGVKRSIYEAKSNDGTGFNYKLWINNQNKMLCRVERTDASGKIVAVMFSKFKDYGGIMMPGRVFVSNAYGSFTRQIFSVDWNLDIDDGVFSPEFKGRDKDLEVLKNSVVVEKSNAGNEKIVSDDKKIEKLQREIRNLKLEIENNEKILAKMENIVMSDRSEVVRLSSITGSSHGRSYGWGWGSSSYDGAANRDSRNRSRLVKDMSKEVERVSDDYRSLNKKILKQRMELADKEDKLAKLKGAKKEAAEEE